MSLKALTWAMSQTVGGPGPKSVLIVLADFADEQGSCFPGQQTIARITEQSVRTVRDQIKDLETAGFIRRERRMSYGNQNGGVTAAQRTSDRYYLTPGNVPANPAGTSASHDTSPGTYRQDPADVPAEPEERTGKIGTTYRQPVAGKPLEEPPVLEPLENPLGEGYVRNHRSAREATETTLPPARSCTDHPVGSAAPCGACAQARKDAEAWHTAHPPRPAVRTDCVDVGAVLADDGPHQQMPSSFRPTWDALRDDLASRARQRRAAPTVRQIVRTRPRAPDPPTCARTAGTAPHEAEA